MRQHSHYHAPMCRLAHTAKNIIYVGIKCQAVFRINLNYCSSTHCYKKAVKDMRLTEQNWNFNLRFCYSYVLICRKCGLPIWLFMYWCMTGSVRPVLANVKAINPLLVMVMPISVVPVCHSHVYFLIANLINHCHIMLKWNLIHWRDGQISVSLLCPSLWHECLLLCVYNMSRIL